MREKIIAIILMCLPLGVMAQNVWEKPKFESENKEEAKKVSKTDKKEAKPNPDEKYLSGAVPVVDGVVEWSTTIDTYGTAEDNYQKMLKFLMEMCKESNQFETSNVSLVNRAEHVIVAHFDEWLVFNKTFLSLDRTKFSYNLMATCTGNTVTLRLFRISYKYEEERNGGHLYKAEDWITDDWAMNKKQTKLTKFSGKFRRKTIDRKDNIFRTITTMLLIK